MTEQTKDGEAVAIEIKDEKWYPDVYIMKVDMDLRAMVRQFGFWKVVWGYDIWLGKIPFLKTLIFINALAATVIYGLVLYR